MKNISEIEAELAEEIGENATLSDVLAATIGKAIISLNMCADKKLCITDLHKNDYIICCWDLSKNLLRNQSEDTKREIHKLLISSK